MKKLAVSFIEELDRYVATCSKCGMCQAVCPIFKQTGKETDVARGKLALLQTVIQQNAFIEPEAVHERLNFCLLCGSCKANCPSGVNVMEIFIKARAMLTEYKGHALVKKILFKKMSENPSSFDKLTQWLSHLQTLLTQDEENPQETFRFKFLSPLISHRHFIPLVKEPFHTKLELSGTKPGRYKKGITAAFFTGCIIDRIFPRIAFSTIEVLKYHGIEVIIPSEQRCCGMPMLASGDLKTFSFLVESNLQSFKKASFDVLVTACATCTNTIKNFWPSMCSDIPTKLKEMLNHLAEKTMDINQFLVQKTELKKISSFGNNNEIVTYHDPCHLKKSLNITEEPREIIRASGKTIAEMKDSDKCCGMGGTFNLLHYNVSRAIGEIKAENIKKTQCVTVATGCPACMIQISDMLARAKSPVKIKHTIELYADELRNDICNRSAEN